MAIRTMFERPGWRVATFLLLLSGCGQKMPAPPPTYPVHGSVTLDGQPVAGGEVCFIPDNDPEALAGKGKLDEQGQYSAGSYMGQEGMRPGKYKVFIESYAPGVHGKLGVEATKTPDKYHSEQTSELTFTVESQDNTYDIDLKGGDEGEQTE